jgi:hypothetical protein
MGISSEIGDALSHKPVWGTTRRPRSSDCISGLQSYNQAGRGPTWEVSPMSKSVWQTETDHLACRWSELDQRFRYDPPWMREASAVPSGYLPPLPDFASHSPFGGPSWFEMHLATRGRE